MDNISHSVVSLVAGELIHRSLPSEDTSERQNLRQKLLLFTACAAGNFPDLDLFLSPLMRTPLGYLLHHRGHSHTFLYEIPQAVLLFALVWICWPSARQLLRESAATRKGYIGATVVGFWLHISMDYLNSYGVHPFHPFDSHWSYGDLVFIVEPLFWISFGVPVAFLTRRLWLRYPLLLFIVGVPLYATFEGYLTWVAIGLLALIATALGLVQSRQGERGRQALVLSFVFGFAFIFFQGFTSGLARKELAAVVRSQDPDAKLLDAAMTAYPSNPFCWNFVTIEENLGLGTYRLRSGLVSLAPRSLLPSACPILMGRPESPRVLSETVSQFSEASEKIATLQNLNTSNCFLSAWLRFARMPLVTSQEATDLRFSRGSRGNFSTLRLDQFEGVKCPAWVPPWDPPRGDLLNH